MKYVTAILKHSATGFQLKQHGESHDPSEGLVKGANSRSMCDERYFEQLSLTIFKSVTVM